MALPAQVQKQTEDVKKLYEEMLPEGDKPVADPVVTAAELPSDGKNPQAPAPQSVTNEPVPDNDDDEKTFKQKYLTLQGMFNSQVPTLTAQNRDLNNRLRSMEQLISTMQQAAPQAQQSQARQPAAQQSLLTDDEKAEYGDTVDVMRRIAQEVAAGYETQIGKLQQEIGQLRQMAPRVEQVAQQQVQSAEQQFWSQLTTTVPNWQAINNDPEFQTWLLAVDPLTGLARQAFLDEAQRLLDVKRVAGFFTTWQRHTDASTAQPNANVPANELEKQVAPGRGRSGGQGQGDQPKTYTALQITEFFGDVRKGVYKGREPERDAIERDIFAAQREGRIVQR